MTKRYTVQFSVIYETIVEVEEGQSLSDAICGLNIPEDEETKYVQDTVELFMVTDTETGIKIETDDIVNL